MYAFVSYQNRDKHVAGQIKEILTMVRIDSFLAHEDIEVSIEWRGKILEEIGKADVFISLLSKNYVESPWCVQESGIAAYRDLPTIPLSLDGTIPNGFAANIQTTRINPDSVSMWDIVPGIVSCDLEFGISLITGLIGRSGSFRTAEANFRMILPHIPNMNDAQIKTLLETSIANDQVHHAGECARDFIPPLLASHGHLLAQEDRDFLIDVCNKYT